MKTDVGLNDWLETRSDALGFPETLEVWRAATERALRAINATERESDLANSRTCEGIRRRIGRDEETW